MIHLSINRFNIHDLDLKNFYFPPISLRYYTERNGQNEMIPTLAVTSKLLFPKPVQLYYEEYPSQHLIAEVQAEVDLFNSDTKKYWTEMLIPLLEDDIEYQEAILEAKKAQLKRTKKNLKKLKNMEGQEN